MERTWRRRNYFIKKDLQGRYIFSFFVFVIAGSFFFTIIFSLLSADTLTIEYRNYDLRLGKTPVILLRDILSAHWIFILAGGILVVLASMLLTHRFAGPVYRFERSIEEMLRGNHDFEIRLRSGDEAKELARLLNELNSSFSSRLREIRELADETGSHIVNAREPAGEAARAELEKAAAANGKLSEKLRSFRLKNDS